MAHKVLEELQRLAVFQDWTVCRTRGGHLRWVNPDGKVVTTSSTPSDEAIIKTIRSDLSRAGLLLDKGEARRRRKKIRRAESERVAANECCPP